MMLVSFIFWSISSLQAQSTCMQAEQLFYLDYTVQPTSYTRLSPKGDLAVVTDFDSNVFLLKFPELLGQKLIKPTISGIRTPLNSEPYPIEPYWEFMSSAFHEDGHRYFKVKDLEEKREKAQPVYSSEFDDYYHSIGSSSKDEFRFLTWSYLLSKKYKVKRLGEEITLAEGSQKQFLCKNLMNLPPFILKELDYFVEDYWRQRSAFAALVSSHVFGDTDKIEEEINNRVKAQGLEVGSDEFEEAYKKIMDEKVGEYLTKNKEKITAEEYKKFSLFDAKLSEYEDSLEEADSDAFSEMILEQPILSYNAKYVTGVFKGETRIYRIEDNLDCTELATVGFRVSKPTYSYHSAPGGDLPWILFYETGSHHSRGAVRPVWLASYSAFNPNIKKLYKFGKAICIEETSSPNMDQYGRIFYRVKLGYKVLDPYQKISGFSSNKSCILKQEITNPQSPF